MACEETGCCKSTLEALLRIIINPTPLPSVPCTQEEELPLAARISASNTYASKLAAREEEDLRRVYDTPELLPKHKIFLSHSGQQKDFTEQLCEDLETHGYYPFFDKRSDALPKGKKFPPLLFKAAEECLVAVVLLSEEFFTRTKWPMLELAAFVKAQKTRKSLHILPVLLGLKVEDLQNSIAKWSKSWTEWEKQDRGRHLTPNVGVEWAAAVQSLRSCNMILKDSYDGEVKLRKCIVEAIMKLIPPDIRSDVLHVQGRERLCREVGTMFDRCSPLTPRICENATILGVHGIGGAGKSTLCMIITEYLRNEFLGRVCVVELGMGASTADLYGQVLRQLCRDDPDFLNKHMNTEKEGLNRLKERICRDRVFLAIDNVSDDRASINTARSFLRLNFHPNSKLLVTSRSDEVLCSSLGIPERSCMQCPSPTKKEALNILLDQVNLPYDCLDTQRRQVLHQVLELSYFKGYHPLACQAFAAQLGTDQSKWKEIKLDIEWTSDLEGSLFSTIETNYLKLPDQQTKDIFMDIALFTPESLCGINDIICWLTDTISLEADRINQKLRTLRIKALLEIWKTEDESFRIHDLYRVLARRNASADTVSPKFIYQPEGETAPKVLLDNGQSRNIERAMFVDAKFAMLGLEACTSLKVLNIRRCKKLRVLRIQRLTYLVSLEVAGCALESLDLSGLRNLRWLHIFSCQDLMRLDASEVEQLLHVNVSKCSKLEKMDFKNCSMVKSVSFMYNDKLSHVNLGNGHSLECLNLWFCGLLENVEISGVASLTTLKKRGCPRLLAMQQGGDIKCGDLQYLSLQKWGRLSSIFVRGLECSASLQVLDIWDCCMSRLPDLRGCLYLQELRLNSVDVLLDLSDYDCRHGDALCEEYEKIMRFSEADVAPPMSLEDVRIRSCRNVVIKEIFWKVQGLRNLRIVSLQDVRVGWEWELFTASNHRKLDERVIDDRIWFHEINPMHHELSMNLLADFSCEVQIEVGVAACWKKLKHSLQVFLEGRSSSPQSKHSTKNELIKHRKLAAEHLASQMDFGCVFCNIMIDSFKIKGSVCWIVEKIFRENLDSCFSLCKKLREKGWLQISAACLLKSCLIYQVREIRGQLHILTAMQLAEIVQDRGVLTYWEWMIIEGLCPRRASELAIPRSATLSENAAEAMTSLEKFLDELQSWCARNRLCQANQIDEQERKQFAWAWLGAVRMCFSLEELKDCLVRQSPVKKELESYLDDVQELIRCNAARLEAEAKECIEGTLVSGSSIGSLIRCWKVHQWLHEMKSCLSEHLLKSGQQLQEANPHEDKLSAQDVVCTSIKDPTLIKYPSGVFSMEVAEGPSSLAHNLSPERLKRAECLLQKMNLENVFSISSRLTDKGPWSAQIHLRGTEDSLPEVDEFLREVQELRLGLECRWGFADLVVQLDMRLWQCRSLCAENSISVGGKMSRWKHAIELYTCTSVGDLHRRGAASVIWSHIRFSFDMAEALSKMLIAQIKSIRHDQPFSYSERESLMIRSLLYYPLYYYSERESLPVAKMLVDYRNSFRGDPQDPYYELQVSLMVQSLLDNVQHYYDLAEESLMRLPVSKMLVAQINSLLSYNKWKSLMRRSLSLLRDELNFLVHIRSYLSKEDVHCRAKLQCLWDKAELTALYEHLHYFNSKDCSISGQLHEAFKNLEEDLGNSVLPGFNEQCKTVLQSDPMHMIKAWGCSAKTLEQEISGTAFPLGEENPLPSSFSVLVGITNEGNGLSSSPQETMPKTFCAIRCRCMWRSSSRSFVRMWDDVNVRQPLLLSFMQCSALHAFRLSSCKLLMVSIPTNCKVQHIDNDSRIASQCST